MKTRFLLPFQFYPVQWNLLLSHCVSYSESWIRLVFRAMKLDGTYSGGLQTTNLGASQELNHPPEEQTSHKSFSNSSISFEIFSMSSIGSISLTKSWICSSNAVSRATFVLLG